MPNCAKRDHLVIGTRGSKLALWQAHYVRDLLLEAEPDLTVAIEIIKTTGDRVLDVALSKVGGKGLFTKELEVALIDGGVDLCVHSMKDVPTVLPEGLVLAAMPPRADVRDALVSRSGATIADLPKGARLGTGSLRRRAQLSALRSDVELVELRGNLDTRMRKVEEGELDAAILASAGITRMGWSDRITGYIPVEDMVPAVGQGAVGIEVREDDAFVAELCSRISDADTMRCVSAERVIMRELEGGCQVPIGAYARIEDGMVFRIDAVVASLDGSNIVHADAVGSPADSERLAAEVVSTLLTEGAGDILAAVRASAGEDGSVVPLY